MLRRIGLFRVASWAIGLSLATTIATSGLRAQEEKKPDQDRPRRARLFERLDADGDGKVSKEEASASDRGAALFERLLRRADDDGDGALGREEFRKGIASDRRGPPGERPGPGRRAGRRGQGGPGLGRMFERLDADGDGKVSKEEIEKADFPAARKRIVEGILRRADRDGDGAVTREELAAALRRDAPGAGRAGRPNPKALIERFDKNGDGKIARSELDLDQVPEGRRRFMENLFERGDKDGNGELTGEEIAAAFPAAPRRGPRAADAPPRRFPGGGPCFAVMDLDGDGKVSRRELTRLAKLISKVDEDGDDALSLPEFAAAARKKAAGELDLGAAEKAKKKVKKEKKARGEEGAKKARREKKKAEKDKATEDGEKKARKEKKAKAAEGGEKKPTRVF